MIQPFGTVENTGRLLRTADLRTLLMEQMQTHIESRQTLINEATDSSVLAKRICEFSKKWEELDSGIDTQCFDISYGIQAAMYEAYK